MKKLTLYSHNLILYLGKIQIMEKEVFAYQWGDKFKRLMDFDKKKFLPFQTSLKSYLIDLGYLRRQAQQAGKEGIFHLIFKVLDGKTLNKCFSV